MCKRVKSAAHQLEFYFVEEAKQIKRLERMMHEFCIGVGCVQEDNA